MLVGFISLLCWDYSDTTDAGAAETPPVASWGWSVTEVPVVQGPGDQITPAIDGGIAGIGGGIVVYNDLNRSPQGRLVIKDLYAGPPVEVSGAGVVAGPDIDGGFIAWQNSNNQACRRDPGGGADQCLALNAATDLSFSGNRAVACLGNNSSVRLVDFGMMSSRYLDSSSLTGSRYGADIDGDQVVWVRERGYPGGYYEPIIYSHNLATNTTSYMTKTGGGVNTDGASKYARQHTSVSGGRVVYQQKLNENGRDWDIYEAVPETFGAAVVQEPGDQVNPSLSGNLVVYQDNRTGHLDESGRWAGEWNIYLKDLSTGIEQPVCTAPGDQISPVIKGNTVVWQDNRNGNWDVYAAVLSPAAADKQLMEQYAPSLVLHHNEDFRPEDAGVMVSSPGSALVENGIEKLRAPGNLSLDGLGDYGVDAFVDLPGKCLICGAHLPDPAFDRVVHAQYVQPYAAVIAGGGHDEAVYGRVAHLGGHTVIQYWINYYFSNHPLLIHEGGWELIEVELDAGMQPSRVSASRHGYGGMRQWQDVEVRDGHPVLYVGRGSHANYFEPGQHSFSAPRLSDPLLIDETDSFVDGKVTTPRVLPLPGAVLDLPGYRWLRFRGRWGEVDDPPVGPPDGSPRSAESPVGPPWSGDMWERPFAWQGLGWDGFTGLEGKPVGLEARVSRAVKVRMTDATGSVGDSLTGEIEPGIPGSQYLDVPAIGQKSIHLARTGVRFDCRLEITATQPASTPLHLSFPDPASESIIALDFGDIPVGPGIVAGLSIGPDSESDGFVLHVDGNGDGVTDMTLLPDVVKRTPIDFIAPSAVGDLQAGRGGDGSVSLSWTAPGDDGNEGAASMYSIRHASQPITEQNWAAAEPVAVIDWPRTAGAPEVMQVNDIPPEAAVYFALKSTDDAGNESSISNLASGLQPRLTLSVGSVFWSSYAAYINEELTVVFRLNNRGDGPAREVALWQITTSNNDVIPGAPPGPIAVLEAGQSADVEIRFHCPPGVKRFATRLYANCRDVNGTEMWFPEPIPVG
jgi:beta propeller repeat protein